MRVVKVLNNSLVLALDEQGREIILMGKGIGFHKASGYEFGADEVEKVFVLRDRSITRSIIRLAAETDSVYFEIGKNVIDYAIETFHMKLLDHIYLSLTDHLAFAVRRVEKEIIVPNFYTQDMQHFNPNEYRVGQYALQVIKEQTGVLLPEDEAGNIAFHFINAQEDHPYNERNRKIKQLTENVLDIVKYYYRLVYDEDSVAYSRYLTHIRLFAQRLVSGQQLPEDASRLLYDQIAQVCTSEFSCVERVDRFVRERFGVGVTNQEEMYLALHIHRVLEAGRMKEEG
ncbi:MAG: PRD domain-containing protein [Lachnospiraceae bacterium]|jgi:beta-glucoside operon transcriptional antiterminator|nr:PRD domain-containing protein [Lachnospiraceae bacterium]